MRRRVLVATLLLLAAIVCPRPAAAAPRATIEVLEQSTESLFPDQLIFRLRVRSDGGEITGAELHFQLGWGEITLMLPAEPFTPAAEVELSAVWDTFADTVPPFVEITYYWKIEDSAGQTSRTEPARVEYADATHDWQRLEDEHVIVFWYDQSTAFGQTLFEAAQESYDHVARITGAAADRPPRVVIYNTQEDFCAFYAPRTCQDFVGGASFFDEGVTVQWGSNLDWFSYDVIPHELAHLIYDGVIFRDTYVLIPTWFNEGIAVYNERTDHAWEMLLVLDAAERGELTDLQLMSARGGSVVDDTVHLWYAQAYSLVAFLVEIYGEETLGQLILTLAGNVPFADALAQTTGLDMAQFELDYRAWLGYPLEAIPTALAMPTLPLATFGPPPIRQPTTIQPTTTATPPAVAAATITPTPQPQMTAPSEPTVPPEETPSTGLFSSPLGIGIGVVALLGAGLVGWWLARRRMAQGDIQNR